MKKCCVCKEKKSFGDFYKDVSRSDGYGVRCRLCESDKSRHKRQELAQFLMDLKLVGCCCCGEKEVCCIDLHHLNSNKEFDIGLITKNKIGFNRVVKELMKCITVCANCHRKIHAGLSVVEPSKEYIAALSSLVKDFADNHPRIKHK